MSACRRRTVCWRLSPKSFLLLSLTNDGNAILREIDVAHPAAKNMIELSRTQDEECGDGTTSVIVLGTPSARIFFFISDITTTAPSRLYNSG